MKWMTKIRDYSRETMMDVNKKSFPNNSELEAYLILIHLKHFHFNFM